MEEVESSAPAERVFEHTNPVESAGKRIPDYQEQPYTTG